MSAPAPVQMEESAEPQASTQSRSSWRRRLSQQEPAALLVAVVAFVVATQLSPYFADGTALLQSGPRYAEIAVIALAMTIVVVNGDIDLSVGSAMALCAALLATLFESGMAMAPAAVLAVLLGAALGAFNGAVVTLFGLPSLVVTLGTLALFRGIAQVLLGDSAVSGYPDSFASLSYEHVPGTAVPLPLVVVAVLALLCGLLLHRTVFGRYCFALGTNRAATRYSGVRVDRVRATAFVLSGTMAGVAAVLITARLGSTRSDVGAGIELAVITVVVLGGTSIFGGRGSMIATLLAICAVLFLREGMALRNLNGQTQDAIVGALLIGSILLPVAWRSARRRFRSTSLRSSATHRS